MRKVFIVARRDYMAMVGSRGFLVGLALAPLMFFGGLIIPPLLRHSGDVDDKHIVVIDRSQAMFPFIEQAAAVRNEHAIRDPKTNKQIESRYLFVKGPTAAIDDQQRLEFSNRVRSGKLAAFVEIPADVLESKRTAQADPIVYYSDNAEISPIRRWLERTLAEIVRAKKFENLGVDLALVRTAEVPVDMQLRGLYKKNSDGEIKPPESTNELLQIFLPIGVMMFVFMVVYMAAWPVLECVFEEKQNRISEMLLGSVNCLQFMTGKLLGTVAGSLTTLSIYITCGLAVAYYNDALDMVPLHIVPWLVLYELLAVILLSSMFLAVGSATGSLQEAQGMLFFVWFPLMIPFFLFTNLLMDPNGSFVTTASLIPPLTPMLMLARMCVSDAVPPWQPVLGALLVLLTTVACVWASSRIFRIAILSQGKVPSLVQLARWAVQGN